MTRFEMAEAKPWHVGAILRRMRGGHETALRALGVDCHRELRRVFDDSSYLRAWLIDGRLGAIGGIMGPLGASEGHLWLVVSEEAGRHPLALMREAKRQLLEATATRAVVSTTVPAGDWTSRRFAEHMGFRLVGEDGGWSRMEYRPSWPSDNRETRAPFIVFALPRSRTRWLATFLSHGRWSCHHDLPLDLDTAADLEAVLRRRWTGSVETGLARGYRFLRQAFPAIRVAVVRRPVPEVRESTKRFGWSFPEHYLEEESARLDAISDEPGVAVADFEELREERGCRRIFEHCLAEPFDRSWWEGLAHRNIQIDMDARRNLLAARGARLGEFFRDLDRQVTIGPECFDRFYRDGRALFAAHYAEAGSFDGRALDPDIEIARALERAGALVIVTARQAERMVGYIVVPINPSFETRGVRIALQNIFYVSPEFRGQTGLRLHAAARQLLKARGVDGLLMRAGVRAEGPRLKHLAKRLRAKSLGELFYLPLAG